MVSRNDPHKIFRENVQNASESDSTAMSIGNGIYLGVGFFFLNVILGAVLGAIFGETTAAVLSLIFIVLILIAWLGPVVGLFPSGRVLPVPMALVVGFVGVWLAVANVGVLGGDLAVIIAWLVGIAMLVAFGITAKKQRRTA